MLATIIVLSLIFVAFWKSIFRFLIAALLVLLVIGGVQAMQAIGAITLTPQPQQTQCADQDQKNC